MIERSTAMKIRSRAPVRLSFAGGGTDVSPYTEEFGGVCINTTINKYAWASLEFRDDGRIHIYSEDYDEEVAADHMNDLKFDGKLDLAKAVVKRMYTDRRGFNLYIRSEAPPRSGLGGSGSACVALIGLFNHLRGENKLTPYEIAELAYKIEREDLKVPGGRQDQYAAVFGGFNFLEFKGHDFVRVTPLRLKTDVQLELEKHLVLVRVPPRKNADDVLADQTKNVKEGKTIESMHSTKRLAMEMKAALMRHDLTTVGVLLHEAWQEKKKFSALISTNEIDALYDLARKHGAIGGKLTGAGGGGHMIFYCKPNSETKVRQALTQAGASVVDFSFDTQGLQVWEAH